LRPRANSASEKSQPASAASPDAHLKIGDVAELIGVSASVIRSWERLGIIQPLRTGSQYRLYSKHDVRILKRARFLTRMRGLNGPAVVELLKAQGLLKPLRNGAASTGQHLRNLRTSRDLSLAEVANAVGISAGFLSAIERSSMSASVGTLRKLARYYKLNILDFFEQTEASPRQVKPADRKRLDAGPGVRMELLAWGDTVMEPHLFSIAPGASSGDSYAHEGEEFIYVLRGTLDISLEGQEYRLKPGDSFYFASSTQHIWRNAGQTETVVLWVNTPPTF
jgi:DNA-binding transcriptional MerR regulator/quercetin dioxygenase-like cupin family protein